MKFGIRNQDRLRSLNSELRRNFFGEKFLFIENCCGDKLEFDEQLMSKGMTENKPPSLKICVATSKEKQPPRNLTKPQRRFYVYLTTEE